MARTSVMTGGSNSYQTTAEDLNAIATDFISDGIVGAVTSTSGVAPTTGGLSVNAQGTPDRTVAIGAGYAYVTATPTSQASQRLRVKIDAQNLTHATNVTGSTRYDWIYVQVSASLAANPALAGDTTGTMVISRSTSSSVDNGTPPTYGYHVATVTLVNNWTTVVNGNIADTRTQTGATSVIPVSTNGTIAAKDLATSAITLGYAASSGTNQTGITTETDLTGVTTTVTVPAGGRRCKITVTGQLYSSVAGDIGSLRIREGASVLKLANYQLNSTTSIQATSIYSAVLTAGSHTYKASLTRNSGTGTLLVENSVAVADILVEAI